MSAPDIDAMAKALSSFVYVFSNEKALHDGVAKVLDVHGVSYEREHTLGKADRLDFLAGGIVIEVKVDGSLPAALQQVDRYLQHECVFGAVIASSRYWARPPRSMTLRDKPVRVIQLSRAAF